jgi:hypothetical protein
MMGRSCQFGQFVENVESLFISDISIIFIQSQSQCNLTMGRRLSIWTVTNSSAVNRFTVTPILILDPFHPNKVQHLKRINSLHVSV